MESKISKTPFASIEQINVSSSKLEKVINTALSELQICKDVPVSVRTSRNSITVITYVGDKQVTFSIKQLKGGKV